MQREHRAYPPRALKRQKRIVRSFVRGDPIHDIQAFLTEYSTGPKTALWVLFDSVVHQVHGVPDHAFGDVAVGVDTSSRRYLVVIGVGVHLCQAGGAVAPPDLSREGFVSTKIGPGGKGAGGSRWVCLSRLGKTWLTSRRFRIRICLDEGWCQIRQVSPSGRRNAITLRRCGNCEMLKGGGF